MKTKLLVISVLLLSPTLSFAQSAGVGGGGNDDYLKVTTENPFLTHCEILRVLTDMRSCSLNSPEAESELRKCGITYNVIND
jgi:hypothetical protein